MVFDAFDQRAADIARHRENRGRLAFAFGNFTTSPNETGSVVFRRRIDFEVNFTEEPAVAYGNSFSLDDFQLAYDDTYDVEDETEIPELPMATGFVTEWDINNHGLYEGAWCAVRVDWPDTAIAVQMHHHFTFGGTALKDVDPGLGT